MMKPSSRREVRGWSPASLARLAVLGTMMLSLLIVGRVGVTPVSAQVIVPGSFAPLSTKPGPDGTPQFDRAIERRTYLKAAPDMLQT